MYEEKRIEFDWKGFLLKLALLIIVIILIIKLLPLDNRNSSKELSNEFKNNMATLREKGTDYFKGDKLPTILDESNQVSLDDLVKIGTVRNLKDTDGNSCDLKNSYVKVSNKSTGYELEIHLICGKESDTSYVYLTKDEGNKTTTTTTTKQANDTTTKKSNNSGNGSNSGGSINKPTEVITSKIKKTTQAPVNVSVIFNTDGGTAIATQYVQIGKTATRPANPTKSGYIFLGWFYNNKEYNFNATVNTNIIVKAKWVTADYNNPVKYTVVFDSNAGTAVATQYVQYGKTVIKPGNPTRSGYTFQGWYYNNKEYNFNTTVNSNITLVAKWALIEYNNPTRYTVTFDSNGGNYKPSQTVEYGGYISKPSDPYKANAEFAGWYLNGQKFNFNTRVYSNITLIAKYYVTETLTTDVYSTGWGAQVTSFKVNHTLAIPTSLNHPDYEDVRIKSYKFIRSLSTSNDLYNYERLHKTTFEASGSNSDYTSGNASNLATISYASLSKISTGKYDRRMTWTGNVSKQCSTPFNYLDVTKACLYGILYQVTWEYEVFR